MRYTVQDFAGLFYVSKVTFVLPFVAKPSERKQSGAWHGYLTYPSLFFVDPRDSRKGRTKGGTQEIEMGTSNIEVL